MDNSDYCWGIYRGYYRDPFPHSLLSTRQMMVSTCSQRYSSTDHGSKHLGTLELTSLLPALSPFLQQGRAPKLWALS